MSSYRLPRNVREGIVLQSTIGADLLHVPSQDEQDFFISEQASGWSYQPSSYRTKLQEEFGADALHLRTAPVIGKEAGAEIYTHSYHRVEKSMLQQDEAAVTPSSSRHGHKDVEWQTVPQSSWLLSSMTVASMTTADRQGEHQDISGEESSLPKQKGRYRIFPEESITGDSGSSSPAAAQRRIVAFQGRTEVENQNTNGNAREQMHIKRGSNSIMDGAKFDEDPGQYFEVKDNNRGTGGRYVDKVSEQDADMGKSRSLQRVLAYQAKSKGKKMHMQQEPNSNQGRSLLPDKDKEITEAQAVLLQSRHHLGSSMEGAKFDEDPGQYFEVKDNNRGTGGRYVDKVSEQDADMGKSRSLQRVLGYQAKSKGKKMHMQQEPNSNQGRSLLPDKDKEITEAQAVLLQSKHHLDSSRSVSLTSDVEKGRKDAKGETTIPADLILDRKAVKKETADSDSGSSAVSLDKVILTETETNSVSSRKKWNEEAKTDENARRNAKKPRSETANETALFATTIYDRRRGKSTGSKAHVGYTQSDSDSNSGAESERQHKKTTLETASPFPYEPHIKSRHWATKPQKIVRSSESDSESSKSSSTNTVIFKPQLPRGKHQAEVVQSSSKRAVKRHHRYIHTTEEQVHHHHRVLKGDEREVVEAEKSDNNRSDDENHVTTDAKEVTEHLTFAALVAGELYQKMMWWVYNKGALTDCHIGLGDNFCFKKQFSVCKDNVTAHVYMDIAYTLTNN